MRRIARSPFPLFSPPEQLAILFDLRDLLLQEKEDKLQTPFPNAGLLSAPAGSRRRVRENGSSTLGLALRLRRLANFDEESKGRESLLGEDCQVAHSNLDRARRRLARARRLRDNGADAPMTLSVEAPLAGPSDDGDLPSLTASAWIVVALRANFGAIAPGGFSARKYGKAYVDTRFVRCTRRAGARPEVNGLEL